MKCNLRYRKHFRYLITEFHFILFGYMYIKCSKRQRNHDEIKLQVVNAEAEAQMYSVLH